MIKYYGTQENPWDLDQASGAHYLELLRSVLKASYPNRDVTLGRSDKIYKFVSTLLSSSSVERPLTLILQVRQRVYDWRKSFQILAIKLVQREINERNLTTRAAIGQFAMDARAPGGEALYDTPNVKVRR